MYSAGRYKNDDMTHCTNSPAAVQLKLNTCILCLHYDMIDMLTGSPSHTFGNVEDNPARRPDAVAASGNGGGHAIISTRPTTA